MSVLKIHPYVRTRVTRHAITQMGLTIVVVTRDSVNKAIYVQVLYHFFLKEIKDLSKHLLLEGIESLK